MYVFIQHTKCDQLQQKLLENYRETLRKGIEFSNEGIAGFPSSIIAIDSAMKDLLHMLKKAALRESNVLLLGETGVGKEVLARGIHAVSKRCDGPFIPVNCGSIPAELFESEFFGYEKGAFTSAAQTKPGYFELANSGTIFLDELGELPLNFQVKLLRVLENRECRRLGGRKSIKLDFRVVAATNKKLMDEVHAGKFRSDLYYRLNVISATIPPLRERKKDILPLANSFIDYFNHKENLNKRLSREAARHLEQYDWPGNIRELRNTIERSIALAPGVIIDREDLNISKDININDNFCSSLASLVGDYEKGIIQERISQLGSIRKAAKSLGVSHATLLRKLDKSRRVP
ncbi:MAG: sigma 54-interacting transcriptional regulator [Desulfovibrio sp.]|nr:sigma 54-interacting transcriptional regulator [Desulfovibrio sp.]